VNAPGLQAAIDAYCQGIYRGDIALLRSVFDPKAALFGDVRGAPYYRTLDDYLDVVAQRSSPQALGEPFRMETVTLEVTGNIALAKLRCPIFEFDYTDYLSFVCQDGQWRIVSKVFTDVPAPA